MDKTIDVIGIGDALVDISSKVSDAFYKAQAAVTPMSRGKFTRVDTPTSKAIYNSIAKLDPPPLITTGGSVVNSVVGVASFGGVSAMIGRVGDDAFGQFFAREMQADNVIPCLSQDQDGHVTGSCIILVTDDGERTMNSHAGAAGLISVSDIEQHKANIQSAQVLLLAGYQFNSAAQRQMLNHAADIARTSDTAVAFTVASERCISDNRAEMMKFLADGKVQILFANEGETKTLANIDDFEKAVGIVSALCETVVTTCGASGAIVSHKGQRIHVSAGEIDALVDTTGAGDQYAAGFLYGYTHGHSVEQSARLGALAAAEIVQVMGPRPPAPYRQLLQKLNQPSQP